MAERSRKKLVLIVFSVLLTGMLLSGGRARALPQQADRDSAPLRLSADLVSITVAVLDTFGRPVLGLDRDDFEIFEDKVKQDIAFFSVDSSPLAIGLVLDSSGSMGRDYKIERARASALHFVKTSHPDDDVFLVDFNSHAAVTLDFTRDWKALEAALEQAKAGGRTALYDAVYLALEKLRAYHTQRRKVILLITDGADNASRHTAKDVERLARESGVQIYAVGICEMDPGRESLDSIRNFADVTSGLAFFTFDTRQLVGICNLIAADLHQQYSIGYRPENEARDGKWRSVKVKVKSRKGLPRVIVRAKEGYYARDSS